MKSVDCELIKKSIREVKYRLGINQSEIADRIGVKNTYLSDMVNGRVPATVNLMEKMKEAFPFLSEENTDSGDSDDSREIAFLKELLQSKEELLQSKDEILRAKDAILKEKDARLKEQEKLIALMEEKVERMADESGKFTAPSVAIATGGNAQAFKNSFGS